MRRRVRASACPQDGPTACSLATAHGIPSIHSPLRSGRRGARPKELCATCEAVSMGPESDGDGGPVTEATASAVLTPFAPRLVVEWLRDEPGTAHRSVDGTLAFVDISGFTAMSERLSSRGKAGAEEVTEVMNATFEALLEVAYAQGGG